MVLMRFQACNHEKPGPLGMGVAQSLQEQAQARYVPAETSDVKNQRRRSCFHCES